MMLLWLTLVIGLVDMVSSSPKRGFCVNTANYMCGDTHALTGSSWWYDWSTHHDEHSRAHCTNVVDKEYVPMVWGHFDANTLSLQAGAHAVLTFNEPNQKDQSNMSPQEAARLWRILESKTAGLKLVSPAPSRCASGPNCNMDPIHWYDQFFAACQGCRIDFLGAHTYSCNVAGDMNYLQTLHNKYNKQIWLTEFACPYHNDMPSVENYMKQIIPQLERAPYIHRYAWFITRWKDDGFLFTNTGLLQAHSSQLSTLGEIYNHL